MIYTLDQQYQIFNYYFTTVRLNTSYKNPLRNDKTPKCYFIEKDNKLIFIDWASFPTHLNCIDFVKNLFNLNEYKDCIQKINIDLKYSDKTKGNFLVKNFINNEESVKAPLINIVKEEKEKVKYDVVLKDDFESSDINYWKQYNINLEILNFYEIKPVKFVLKNNVINYSSSKYNPIFGYFENNVLYKIYNPLGHYTQKWRTINAILEGYSKLQFKTNVCFITSSLKDTMCLKSLGYDCFNLPSENSYKILLPLIDILFTKYEHVYIYNDNDDAGKKFSRLLTLELDSRLKYINNPSFLKEKDPSDIIKNRSISFLTSIIDEKLKRDNVNLLLNE
jgi:hypothetical protein